MLADSKPKVSVGIIAYNIERLIGQAIESVLMQRTDFTVQLVIGEDCSTDRTRAIILDFQRRFPERIKVLIREQNLGYPRNTLETVAECSGEYLAWLDGDDYWTSADKLQRQVDFLEAHPQCALCFHRVEVLQEPAGTIAFEHPPVQYRRPILSGADIATEKFIAASSLVCRRTFFPNLDEGFWSLKAHDWPLHLLLSERGEAGYVDEVMARYRIHPQSSWSSMPLHEQWPHLIAMFQYVAPRLSGKKRSIIVGKTALTLVRLASYYSRQGELAVGRKYLKQALLYSPHAGPKTMQKMGRLGLELYMPGCVRLLRWAKRLSDRSQRTSCRDTK
jgi:glycosyltransferase involved in cell wall biosynthesis